jgi:hypothetical protein
MKRRELNETEIELINKKKKIDDKKAIDEFLRSRRITLCNELLFNK